MRLDARDVQEPSPQRVRDTGSLLTLGLGLGIGLVLGLGLGLGMGDFTEASAPRPIRSIVTLYSTV
jgi:ABC-type nitrate/sulfonate/bicarbonate transport system permease component